MSMDTKQFEELRKEIQKYKRRTTVCTPTFILSRRSPGVSVFMGWIIFLVFLSITFFILVAMYKTVSSYLLPQEIKVILIGFLGVCIYACMVGMFIVDSLTSQDERQAQMVEALKKIEEHSYNQFALSGKLVSKRETKGE